MSDIALNGEPSGLPSLRRALDVLTAATPAPAKARKPRRERVRLEKQVLSQLEKTSLSDGQKRLIALHVVDGDEAFVTVGSAEAPRTV